MNLRVHSGQMSELIDVLEYCVWCVHWSRSIMTITTIANLHGFTQVYFLFTKNFAYEWAGVSDHHSCLGTWANMIYLNTHFMMTTAKEKKHVKLLNEYIYIPGSNLYHFCSKTASMGQSKSQCHVSLQGHEKVQN